MRSPASRTTRTLSRSGLPVLVFLVALAATFAAEPGATKPAAEPARWVPLEIGGRVVHVFRSGLGAATPEERAELARRRFEAATEAGPGEVTLESFPEGIRVLIAGHPILTVLPGDVDPEAGESLEQAAHQVAGRLRLVIGEVAEGRNVKAFLTALSRTAIATALAALLVALLMSVRGRLLARFEAAAERVASKTSVKGFVLLTPRQIVRFQRGAVALVVVASFTAILYLWLYYTLTLFPRTRAWGENLGDVLFGTLADLGIGALRSIPGLFTVFLIFLATYWLSRLAQVIFHAIEEGRLLLPLIHPEIAAPTRRIVNSLLWVFAVVLAYPHLPGAGTEAFTGVSVLTGILVTFGSAGLVGHAMAGLVLMYTRSFMAGDRVEIGATTGIIQELGLLSTRIRTAWGESVTVPNGVVIGGQITNFSLPAREKRPLFVHAAVTLGYDAPWRKVEEAMIEAARATEGLLAEPAPFVLQTSLNDFHVGYRVGAALDPRCVEDIFVVRSRLMASLQDSFNKAGIEILSPTYLSLRDGNRSTIPEPHTPSGRPGAFRVDVDPG